ncbi:hypothetical protein GM3708_285 [Geminocystis sp. NIES-3708]|nr:hypothetical protein GM3708_285 [Geminocystis sp. NIES-3708]
MLGVQRGLQESQLKLQESQIKLHDEQLKLNTALEQLLNLHIAQEIKQIDYEERLLQLTRRIENLEKS